MNIVGSSNFIMNFFFSERGYIHLLNIILDNMLFKAYIVCLKKLTDEDIKNYKSWVISLYIYE